MARILFLSHRIPYPPNKGDKIRAWAMIEHLLKAGHSISLGCFIDDPRDWEHIPYLESRLDTVKAVSLPRWRQAIGAAVGLLRGRALSLSAYPVHAIRRFIRAERRKGYDLIIAYSGASAALLERDDWLQIPVLLDLVDVDSAKWAAYAQSVGGIMAWLYRREARLLARAEIAFTSYARATLLVSEAEAALYRDRLPSLLAIRVHAVTNGVDTDRFDPERLRQLPEAGRILFTGAMTYPPNVEAVLWFAAHVWPHVRAQRPEARFVIAGGPVDAKVAALAADDSGITVLGYVADMELELARAECVVAPLRTARGIQNKVLEGMAMAKPVIASPQAFEGIDAVPDRHLLVADGSDAFVSAVLTLGDDPVRRRQLGQAARRQVMRAHSWSTSLAKVEMLLAGWL